MFSYDECFKLAHTIDIPENTPSLENRRCWVARGCVELGLYLRWSVRRVAISSSKYTQSESPTVRERWSFFSISVRMTGITIDIS